MKNEKNAPEPFPGRAERLLRTVFVAAFAAVLLAGFSAKAQHIQQASADASGIPANGPSHEGDISGNGRYAAFSSTADNLVPGDINGTTDVFVKDRVTGSVELVSVDSQGNATGGGGAGAAISREGRFVAFYSEADDLVPGDTNGLSDIFVHDRVTKQTHRVSISTGGVETNDSCYEYNLSGDGRYVVFISDADNLVPGDTNGSSDVFLRDTRTGTTTRVSTGPDGVEANDSSNEPSISGDGRYVVFNSAATNLVPGDTNGHEDVFILDRSSGVVERVSVGASGEEANGSSYQGSPSDDGRFVVFHSSADNLAPGDYNSDCDIYLRDRATGSTRLVSRGYDGLAGAGNSTDAHLSADGRFVVFDSTAPDLVAGDTSDRDVFFYDVLTGRLTLASATAAGRPGNGPSYHSYLTDDGRSLVFESAATDLVAGDTNGVTDIFVGDTVPTWPPCDQNKDGRFTMKDVYTFKHACRERAVDFVCDLDDSGVFRRDWLQFRLGCRMDPPWYPWE